MPSRAVRQLAMYLLRLPPAQHRYARLRPVLAALALLQLLLPTSLSAATTTLPAHVAAALSAARVPLSSVAVYVRDVDGARPLLVHNAAQAMNPASTMKLLTTYAGLELLGPSHTWKTEVYSEGELRDGVLLGDLALKGYGDPKLTFERFWLMLRQLRALGLREIRGGLVLDRSYFEPAAHDPGSFDAEPLRPYNVGADALLLNFKTVRFQFLPEAQAKRVAVLAEPKPAGLEFAASVRATEGECGDWRAGIKAEFESNGAAARARFSGSMPASCGERYWNVSLLSPPDYVYGVFKQIWEELGGSISGGWKAASVPKDRVPLVSITSPSAAEMVRDINKFSNNVMARQLYLTLSAEVEAPPGSYARSAEVLRTWLAQKELHFPELVVDNGAGLSRQARISAEHMAAVLLDAWRSAVMPEFLSSLPLVAYDGTMRRRLRDESIAGQAHLKTGSLADARTLAGFVRDRLGRRRVVVLFVNHPNAAATASAQDALLEWVYAGAQTRRP